MILAAGCPYCQSRTFECDTPEVAPEVYENICKSCGKTSYHIEETNEQVKEWPPS